MKQSKPRIAVIGLKGIPAFGGAATVGENLITELKPHYEFTVLSVSSHTDFSNTELDGVRQIVFPNYGNGAFNTLLYYINCLSHVMFNNYDLIHLHHAESGFITPFLRLRYKVIVTFHGIYNYTDPKFSLVHNWFFRFSERLNILFASQVVSVSKPDKQYIKNKYGRDIDYIPNGISLNRELLNILDGKDEKDYWLFAAGRIYEIKGLHLLLKAVRSMGANVKIKVAGDIDQVEDYKDEILNLSYGLNVNFIGLIKQKHELMKLVCDAGLFVFPSLTEAMSMMLLEVVSMKTPVIASDIPSNRAIFSDDEMLFFRSNDVDDLAEKLKYAMTNKEKMKENAERAYEKLAAQYTWEGIASKYNKHYKRLLS
jgi:glycosyltransferase involved in cell wall biosynthesis